MSKCSKSFSMLISTKSNNFSHIGRGIRVLSIVTAVRSKSLLFIVQYAILVSKKCLNCTFCFICCQLKNDSPLVVDELYFLVGSVVSHTVVYDDVKTLVLAPHVDEQRHRVPHVHRTGYPVS